MQVDRVDEDDLVGLFHFLHTLFFVFAVELQFLFEDGETEDEIIDSIVDCKVEFPRERVVTDEVKDLLSKILQAKPEERPELFHIMTHPWFDLDEDDIEERHEAVRKRMEEEDAAAKEKEEDKKEEELKLSYKKAEKAEKGKSAHALHGEYHHGPHHHSHHDNHKELLRPPAKGHGHRGSKSPGRVKSYKAGRSDKKNS